MLRTIGSGWRAIKDPGDLLFDEFRWRGARLSTSEDILRLHSLAREARTLLAGKLIRTPLLEVTPPRLQKWPGRLLLKLENQQVSGSFKARGATHFICQLLAQSSQLPAGVLTYSSGNHGRALAEVAAAEGIAALVVAPSTIDGSKAEAITAAGAELVKVGPTTDERKQEAQRIALQRGWVLVPPFDHEWIAAGQGTLILEVLEQLDEAGLAAPEHLWVPVGGGGLASGCAAVVAVECPDCQVHAVEPEGSASLARSLAAGSHLKLAETGSEADGLLPLTVGDLNWKLLQAAAVSSETITEEQLLAALKLLHREFGVDSEPSGACAVAPLLAPAADRKPQEGVHVAVISGGNVSEERLQRLISP